MAAWKKKFERWENASSPVDVEEVENLLPRIFGERVRETSSTSHRWQIDVSELAGTPGFTLPNMPICVRGGQKVLPVYLQNAYKAAGLLGLYPPETKDEKEIESNEQNS